MTSPGEAADFRPTHIVPQEGLAAWETPDLSRPTVPLDEFLPVQLVSRRGEWGEVLCANGWSAWVDGRMLVPVPQPPPTGGRPVSRSENPQPLLDRCADDLERYRKAAADLARGRTDAESFRRAVRGLRAGVVIEGGSVWLYDAPSGRWMYGDGSRLMTYAVVAGPGAPPVRQTAPEEPDTEGGADVRDVRHDPTKIVELPGPEVG
ncbi:hypothetical protein J7E97_02005 [Streptomyces sp. ISL-66]|uniref:hypothetical protein n=1 Tax=Streptomyces sp. ISL-66 TaxID=2819186 RepID=UPI001BE6EEB6|nr:hypothetical protein [Streptomyces sp. ISL-66]MBT2466671.1 hypothetical protein [Streptomyces sp. ISL-66]